MLPPGFEPGSQPFFVLMKLFLKVYSKGPRPWPLDYRSKRVGLGGFEPPTPG